MKRLSESIKLPLYPFTNIAISLSGGGYRAAAFHLGSLTFLSQKNWQGTSLLKRVRVLSTVSGGTFTGVKYAATIKKNGTIEQCYKDLYEFMATNDLVGKALAYLSDDANWATGRQRSLINAFASIYHQDFETECFELFWKEQPDIHLKEISFNATEFNFAIPFRFQKTEESKDGEGNYVSGFIGNNKIRIPIELAKEIRLSDITAASSCFPLGFEPINFPNDFVHNLESKLLDSKLLPSITYDGDMINYPVGLMDGGIDDNQGMNSVYWAEKRISNYREGMREKYGSLDSKSIDLYIISDVASPYMDSYIRTETTEVPAIGKWSFGILRRISLIIAVLSVVAFVSTCLIDSKLAVILLSVFGAVTAILAVIFLLSSNALTILARNVGVPAFFTDKLKHFKSLHFNTLFNMIINRGNSAKIMVSDVFMKQIRRFSYSHMYDDDLWKSRLVMNAVYELTPAEVKKRSIKHSYLSSALNNPDQKIMDVSKKAADMGTTLWFSDGELRGDNNMLDTLIACGQFTICFNMLEYIERWLKNPQFQECYKGYTKEVKDEIDLLYKALMIDWTAFQNDPYWMVKEWNERINKL